ncbi:MAG TPA: fumarylacetoacetate hydrolase family protein [Acidobacteriaceae bacterium]|nr:fumarylacetoacetate hydrolase family protein [Acidobacteriaceae bacterium]
MKLYNTTQGPLVTQDENRFAALDATWDELITDASLHDRAQKALAQATLPAPAPDSLRAPIGTQEVWAAGVTYYRSRNARMEESKDAGGGTFYDRVYTAERPELFFKSTPRRVVGPGQKVRIRRDAIWSVPEPELTLLLSPRGDILGYTCGNDMSSRDIEGENPLYLPQAKVYEGACALGPCVFLRSERLPSATTIGLSITRSGEPAFAAQTTLAELKRNPVDLAGYLFRELSFPTGAFLMTGTGIVPPDDFSLRAGDLISITIAGIGTLTNPVA